MTKKDYALVAKCIKAMIDGCNKMAYQDERYLSKEPYRKLVGKLVSEFQLDNPKFDKDKFIKACGLKEGK